MLLIITIVVLAILIFIIMLDHNKKINIIMKDLGIKISKKRRIQCKNYFKNKK